MDFSKKTFQILRFAQYGIDLRLCFIFIVISPIVMLSQVETEFTIRILQDKRVENSSGLYSFLNSPNERERELALLAIANIQDTSAIDQVIPLLSDESSKVRSMAAFALGMIGTPKGAAVLFRRMAVERDNKCIGEIFNAIGMCGTADDLKHLIALSESFPRRWKTYAAVSVMRFANRGIKDIAATRYVASMLNSTATVLNATYALMRINDTTVIRKNRERLAILSRNGSPLLRMWAATMLGALNDNVSLLRLLTLAKRDKDWRVRVNAVRALRMKKKFKRDILNLLADKNEHVALTAMASYDAMTADETSFRDSAKFLSILSSDVHAVSVKEVARSYIAKKLGEHAIPMVGTWKSDQPHISAQRVRALGETRSPQAIPMIMEAMQQSNQSTVVIAGIESYQTIARQMDDIAQREFLKQAVLQFRKNDPGISYAAAIAFQDTSFRLETRKIFLSELISTYRGMKASSDLEPMVELLNHFADIADSSALAVVEKGLAEPDKVIRTTAERAYKAITGKDAPVRFVKNPDEYKPFYTMEDVALLSKYSGAEITTSKGTIKITFEKKAAPFTVLNFILLAQKKFYDGLSFHRVVSNFVIQGGDPLGNGSGGPNYAIRTEVHPNIKYKTGAVGMASAGKDTEGSQWFVTHCPTPHLDFRYTIFGYTKDAAVVDKIMVGDRIEKVSLY